MDRVWFIGMVIGVCGRVEGERFIMRESVDRAVGEETCMVDGAVVDDLDEGIVFISDSCVVDVY